MFELEVIGFDLASCIIAEQKGANRIELCANPFEGGTTPSYGMISIARKNTSIQLFPIIRPRGGDFFYTNEEHQSMIEDIEQCKNLGCDGVVIGMLLKNGEIDKDRCAELIHHAGSMEVTFHRAFDRVRDPFVALEDVISLGCKRILTSGLHPNVDLGKDTLKQLVQAAGHRIRIMAGSGVRSTNIIDLAKYTGATSFHSSARMSYATQMDHRNHEMNEDLHSIGIDPVEVEKLRQLLDTYSKDC